MDSKEIDILANSLIYDDDSEFMSKFKSLNIVLDDTFFDYELLKEALNIKREKIANFLIDEGCRISNLNAVDSESTPLHLAMELDGDDFSIITKILNKGASIYAKNCVQQTPLHAAFNSERFAAITTVLDFMSRNFKNFNPGNKDDVVHFQIACTVNHTESVKLYLAAGFNVNSKYRLNIAKNSRVSVLHHVLSRNDKEDDFIQILVHHSNFSVKNRYGLTPLHFIYYRSNYTSCTLSSIMQRIFKYGNISKFNNVVDCNKVSHFHLSCLTNCTDVVQKFINCNVNVNSFISFLSPNNPGFTPLHFAADNDRVEVVELLLKNGADSNIVDKKGVTPLHLVCLKSLTDERIKIIELLLKYNSCPHAIDKRGNTPVHLIFDNLFCHFVDSKAKNILDKLLSKVPSTFNVITNKKGISFFHIACTRSNVNIVNDHINSVVAIDDSVIYGRYCGYTALHFAVLFNQLKVVKLLLMKSAQVNIKADKLDTPLHLACEITRLVTCEVNCDYETIISNRLNDKSIFINWSFDRISQLFIAELLLQEGADVNAKDVAGNSPLFRACMVDCFAHTNWPVYIQNIINKEIKARLMGIINILFSHNANVLASNNDQWSILHFIFRNNSLPIEILRDLVERLVLAGAEINAIDDYGSTPLHFALLNSNITDELVEYLVIKGAHVNKMNNNGLTPFHLVVQQNKKNLVQIFLDHNADVHIESYEYGTPIEIAVTSLNQSENPKDDNIMAIIDILLKSGSDVKTFNKEGKSLLHLAISSRNDVLAEKLLQYGADINAEDSEGETVAVHLIGKIEVSLVIYFYVVRLRALGFQMHDQVNTFCTRFQQYLEYLFSCPVGKSFISHTFVYNDELKILKNKKIDRYTSLYDILIKNPHEVSRHVKNENLIEVVKRQNLKKEFPWYSYLIKLQYNKGLCRRAILESAVESLSDVTGTYLPVPCYDSILSYMTNEEIDNLKEALYVKDKCKRKINDNKPSDEEPPAKLQK